VATQGTWRGKSPGSSLPDRGDQNSRRRQLEPLEPALRIERQRSGDGAGQVNGRSLRPGFAAGRDRRPAAATGVDRGYTGAGRGCRGRDREKKGEDAVIEQDQVPAAG